MLSKLFSKSAKSKCVAAHEYENKIILVAEDRLRDGFWIFTDNYEVLDKSIDNNTLGEKIRSLADRSSVGVQNPKSQEEFKEIGKILQRAGNFKTQKESRQCKYCNVTIKDGLIEIGPSINKGSKGHHYFDAEFNVDKSLSNFELGQALRNGWDRCK